MTSPPSRTAADSDAPGGLTPKLHLALEQRQKPMSIAVEAAQRGDSRCFEVTLGRIRVPRSVDAEGVS
ncbi:hypothetical protein [Streptomyces peucetius]|nr:hypothetical protein CGZ69_01375 [Streptomyces peucetius subsp. caesius ATCC 27952]